MAMLDTYLSRTQQLLQNPPAPTSLYSTEDLTAWINMARGQLAGEAECCRVLGTISTVIDQRNYDFADIDIGDSDTTGLDGIINVRQALYQIGDGAGRRWMTPKAWEWFTLYSLNNPAPVSGEPKRWSQFAQGAAPGDTGSSAGGSFYIDPPPDAVYTLYLDCTCYPVPITSAEDTPPEAIPYLWTDAVPFFAAYYALLSAQNNARLADAERYFNHYQNFLERARKASNPSVGRWQYSQAQDPAQASKLGMKSAQGAG